ncbi:MAG TPA: VTT domain-containing protein [Myxococcota bacterium]|nr:VTT domain-containing protein [Myxococcota bacterium]
MPSNRANESPPAAVLRPGKTCWRAVEAGRVAFLVDGEAFFAAAAETLENARESAWLIGWDFHSNVALRRSDARGGPDELVALLEACVRRRPALQVRVLAWDFAMLYALEREFLPLLQFGARTHRRIHFAMDAVHPVGASHHQKLVVVDDAVAFTGGFDLTAHRWDTRDHAPDDPRRTTPAGKPYPPFHDVQIAVDGEAAAVLGELARERWRRATGERIDATGDGSDPWPAGVEPAVRDARVGIARTLPAFGEQPEVREVAALYRASIAEARRWIYVENQYLTTATVVGELAERLREPGGPEVVIVAPRENVGWLEQNTMGALRARAVRELRAADADGDRLRVVYPHREGLAEGEIVNVHAKVMVVDDAFARVGSSNLSNRSLGLDSECDVALEACGREDVTRAIAAFRDDLLAEHLGTTAKRVAQTLERTGSLVGTLDALAGDGPRTLRPLEVEASDRAAAAVEAFGAVDPEHPAALDELVSRFETDGAPAAARGRTADGLRLLVPALVLAAVALAWQTTPLGELVTGERLAAAIGFVRESPLGPVLATGAFVLACLALVPVTALIVASGLTFDPATAFAVAWVGSLAAAVAGHRLGRHLWRDAVRRRAGDRLNALTRRLARRGVVSTALLRIVPVAPFMMVNLVAGASRVSTRDFTVGTALGMLPGTALMVLGAAGIRAAWSAPAGPPWLWAGLAILALLGALALLRRVAARLDPTD